MAKVALSNGRQLDMEDCGPPGGVAVLLVHGFTGGKWYWRDVRARLAAGRRVVTVDLAGHGESDKPHPDQTSYGIGQYCRDIAELARALHVGPYVLVGHSMGGMIALTYARNGGDSALRGIVVVASTGRLSIPDGFGDDYRPFVSMLTNGELPEETERAFNALGFSPGFAVKYPEVLEENYRESLKTPDAVKAALLVAMFEEYSSPELGRFASVRTPTLLVSAEHDNLTPAAETDALAAIIPGCRIERIKDSGHSIPLEQPAALAAAIERFVETL